MSTVPATPSAGTPYDAFAAAYDRWMAEDFCRRALPALEQLVVSHLPAGAPVLDLCCGTGRLARRLHQRGLVVTGIDVSEPMLALAARNAHGIRFLRADARAFTLPQKFAAVLSTFNSLAHVETSDELESVFRNVRAVLEANAPFLFDLSMEEAYIQKWRGSFGRVDEDLECIARLSYDSSRRRARNEFTIFCRRSGLQDAPWERSDICIEQKCHPEPELRAALARAGFRDVAAFDAERDLGMSGESGRTFFLCRAEEAR